MIPCTPDLHAPSASVVRVTSMYAPCPCERPEAEETFLPLVQTDTLHLERIVSHGRATPTGTWYDQPDPEWVMLLRGQASLSVENQGELALQAGDACIIPARVRHRVEYCSEDAIWIALHHAASAKPPGPASQGCVASSSSERNVS